MGKVLITMLLLLVVLLLVSGCGVQKQNSREISDYDKSITEQAILQQLEELVTKKFIITGFT